MSSVIDQYAKQYVMFENERTRPVRDLVAAIPNDMGDVAVAADLGCGPGNSTEVLAARFVGARISGADSSADMIETARKRLPELRFDLVAIEDWRAESPCDVILANASLQWVPDHAALMPRLAGQLAPGGSLAVQMPDAREEPAQVLMRAVAAQDPWAARLADVERVPLDSVDGYYASLNPHCSRVDVWRTTYHHVLAGGSQAVVEWFKASALRPYLKRLSAAEQTEFLERYATEVARAYPALDDGSVLLPFPRLFFVATR
jgi:trans-aconitate 2-methyltransferase